MNFEEFHRNRRILKKQSANNIFLLIHCLSFGVDEKSC